MSARAQTNEYRIPQPIKLWVVMFSLCHVVHVRKCKSDFALAPTISCILVPTIVS